MTHDRWEVNDGAIEMTDGVIEALRRGRAPEPPSLQQHDVTAVRMATLLAMGAGRSLCPDAAFLSRLEGDLLARQAAYTASGRERRRPSPFPRWPRLAVRAGIALALPVLMVAALLLVRGPRQALADVRRLLSYVPGLGFVATQDARLLAEPVAVTREAITVRVEQVVAGARDTRIVVDVDAPGIVQDRETMTRVPDAGIALRAVMGAEPAPTQLSPMEWSQSAEGVVLTFAPLPADADSAVLTMRVPPGLPAGAVAPGEWTFRLPLRREGEAADEGRLVSPYEPGIPAQEHHGIALRVLDVAHSAEETVVRVAIDAHRVLEAEDTSFHGMPPHLGGRRLPTLRDDAGLSYRAGRAPGVGFEAGAVVEPAPAEPVTAEVPLTHREVLAFEPLQPGARTLALSVDGVAVDVPATGKVHVNLGTAPAVGDIFPVDVELQVAGATVRLTGATLVREELALRDEVLVRTLLQFEAEQVSPRHEMVVNTLTMAGDPAVVSGSPSHGGPEGVYSVGVEFRDGHIPTGVLTLSLERAGVIYLGPWEFTWEVPPATRP